MAHVFVRSSFPHPVSKLEAAPAALRLPEGMLQGNKDLLPENERENGLKQRRQGKTPLDKQ